MALGSPVESNSGSAPAGTPRTVTVGLPSFTVNKGLIVLEIAARAPIVAGWVINTPTWDGVNMTLAVSRPAALNGNGLAFSEIWYLAIGNVVSLVADAVASVSISSTTIALEATVKVYETADQAAPLNDTNDIAFISGASSITLSCNSDSTDRVVGCVCFAEAAASSALPTSGQAKVTGISTTTGGPMAHVSGDESGDASSTAGNWGSFSSSYIYTMASFVEDASTPAPVITNVDGGVTAVSNETNLAVNGTTLNPGGTTALYYGDGANFGTATLVAQSISGVTSTTLNWDAISLGSIGVGENFLFVVTDEGEAGEQVSAAFAFEVTQAPPTIADVNGLASAEVGETNLAVNGSELNPPGTTRLYYADGPVFAVAITKEQVISSITDSSLNWDAIDVSIIGVGANFLFVVTDDGGSNEQVSAAFAFTITEPAPVGHVRLGGCAPSVNGVPPSMVDHSIINVGGFAEVYRTGTPATQFELRTHESSDASVAIVQNVNDLDFTVPTGSDPSQVFQVDSTSTRLSSTTTLTTWLILAGDAAVLDGEEWKINMGLLVCNPVSDTSNSEMVWQIETSTGVFAEFDRYSSHAGLTIVGDEKSMPIERWKNLVASMDAPRMRIQVHRIAAGSSVLWEEPRWGGVRIAVAS